MVLGGRSRSSKVGCISRKSLGSRQLMRMLPAYVNGFEGVSLCCCQIVVATSILLFACLPQVLTLNMMLGKAVEPIKACPGDPHQVHIPK